MAGAFQSDAFQSDAFQEDAGSTTVYVFAQAQCQVKQTYRGYAQAQCDIKAISRGFGQAQCLVGSIGRGYGQAQCDVKATSQGFAQAQCAVKSTSRGFAQAKCLIRSTTIYAQAQAQIAYSARGVAQAAARITSDIVYSYCPILYESFTKTTSLDDDLSPPDIGPNYVYGSIPQQGTILSGVLADGSNLVVNNLGSMSLATKFVSTISDQVATVDFLPTYSSFATYAQIALLNEISHYLNIQVTDMGLDPIQKSQLAINGDTTSHSIDDISLITDGTTWYTLKVQIEGSAYKIKYWQRDNESEPDWLIEDNDTFVADLYVRLKAFGGISPVVTQKLDNWTVSTPCPTTVKRAQAQALISQPSPRQYAQAQARITGLNRAYAQAQALIPSGTTKFGQAQAKIRTTTWGFGQAQCRIDGSTTISRAAQAQAQIEKSAGYAQAQARLIAFGVEGFAQVQTDIRVTSRGFAQAKTTIALKSSKFGQAKTHIHRINYSYGLAQVHITNVTSRGYGQANALINSTHKQAYGQAQAQIRRSIAFAQAQAMINAHFKMAQSQVLIVRSFLRYGQSQAYIKAVSNDDAFYGGLAQAQVLIISGSKYAQAQARIRRSDGKGYAQAQARIRRSIGFAQAQTFITGGRYLVRYNQYLLPGYAQTESLTSGIRIDDHYAPYFDSSLSEYMGLENKTIPITMRVAESTYLESKEQVQLAGTMIRSTKSWAKLYIQRSDRHYEALSTSIKMEQSAESKYIDYTVEFNAKPWLISDAIYTVSGTNLITITRTLDDGGWTPATVRVSGTNITISGYSTTESYTGFISLSGAINNMVVTTQPFTATVNGVNSLPYINNIDYELYVGPGTTYISVDGATDCVITYNNRWYL